LPDGAGRVKQELIATRIARRLGVNELTVWQRLRELRAGRRQGEARPAQPESAPKSARPAPEERELLEVLLADPDLVKTARVEVQADEVRHPGLRRLLEGLYTLHDAGEVPDLDALRPDLGDNPALARKALDLQDIGLKNNDRPTWLKRIVRTFEDRRLREHKKGLHQQLSAADGDAAVELLRQLQDPKVGTDR
jgi:DNA primase